MRTTLTLDDFVAERLQQEAVLGRKSFKETVNAVLRRGLGVDQPKPREPFRVQPHSSAFRAGIDPARLNQLADELEAEEFRQSKA